MKPHVKPLECGKTCENQWKIQSNSVNPIKTCKTQLSPVKPSTNPVKVDSTWKSSQRNPLECSGTCSNPLKTPVKLGKLSTNPVKLGSTHGNPVKKKNVGMQWNVLQSTEEASQTRYNWSQKVSPRTKKKRRVPKTVK